MSRKTEQNEAPPLWPYVRLTLILCVTIAGAALLACLAVSLIEVSFDIDANGILHVGAKIAITCAPNFSKQCTPTVRLVRLRPSCEAVSAALENGGAIGVGTGFRFNYPFRLANCAWDSSVLIVRNVHTPRSVP